MKECIKCGKEHETPARHWAKHYPVCSQECWDRMKADSGKTLTAKWLRENKENGEKSMSEPTQSVSIPASFGTRYIVEELLSEHRVHLIGGPSGSGKTTLVFQMLDAMAKGEPFLGRQTTPVKLAYISADRSAKAVKESMRRVGVDFPVFSLVDESMINEDLLDSVFPRLTAVCGHRPDFIYIDGFTAMVPGGFMNNYVVVAKWLGRLAKYCERMGVTLLGACHTTKTKEGEKFLNPRQRIAGSVAWAGFSESIIIIEPPDDAKNDATRLVSLLPRNFKAEHITLTFNDEGRLEAPAKIVHQEEVTNFIMEEIIQNFGVGEEITFQQIWNLAERKNMVRRTTERWLTKYVSCGKLIKHGKGVYVIPQAETATVN